MASITPLRCARSPSHASSADNPKMRRLEATGIVVSLRSAEPPYSEIAQNALEAFVHESRPRLAFPVAYSFDTVRGWVRSRIGGNEHIRISVGPPDPTHSHAMEMDEIDGIDA
ncbi:hypothetical protein NPX13_g7416 [Xylaria arbuscula]|uniref:Uncharacterized protein n=1 Tax=Xylaria arbuscula TaxID=114810 RepID=A0A9W8NAK7_9PEZI|nr:hypothetical protein NPX13_g7416 [Xylaria arbuscula]